LINRARSFIYSTAPSPAIAAAAKAAIDFLVSPEGMVRRMCLFENLVRFAEGLPDRFRREETTQSAIFPIVLGTEEQALAASRWLRQHGFLIPAIRFPTVPRGTARLRITISALHTEEQISALCTALTKLAADQAG